MAFRKYPSEKPKENNLYRVIVRDKDCWYIETYMWKDDHWVKPWQSTASDDVIGWEEK